MNNMLRKRRQTSNQICGDKHSSAKEVQISVVFTRINDIDTINEKFSCEATIFATWKEDVDNLKRFSDNNSQDLDDPDMKTYYWNPNTYWDPQLYIDNAIGEVKEKDVKYRLESKTDFDTQEPYLEVHMIKRIQGVFFEKLELYHFPFDIQDLSLTIISHRPASEIHLVQDYKNPPKVTKHASLDKHIWKLHDHINVKMQTLTSDYQITLNFETDSAYCHSSIAFQCRVSRRPGYFVVNCLLPTLMITLCVFFTFLMDYKRYQYRFSLLFTSMLTSVTFRFSIHGRVLPTISYLTFLDMYCVSSIFIVFTCMICHGIYCLIHKTNEELALQFDQYAIWFIGLIVFIMHLVQIIWFTVAIRKRNKLDLLDRNVVLNNIRLRKSEHIINRNISQTALFAKRKIYFSVGNIPDSNFILFKQYPTNDSLSSTNQYDHQNTLTTSAYVKNADIHRFSLGSNSMHHVNNEEFVKTYLGNPSNKLNSSSHVPLIQQSSKDSKE